MGDDFTWHFVNEPKNLLRFDPNCECCRALVAHLPATQAEARRAAFDEAIRWFGGGGEGKSIAEAVHDERVVEELRALRDKQK